jgi:PIN domain nuclease of toxin-antitoxin system
LKVLIDTHAFLWWCLDDPQLSDDAQSAIADEANTVIVSAVVGWEIAIKYRLGKLPLPEEPRQFVTSRVPLNRFAVLDISMAHALHVVSLADKHRDPFDRMLVAQAQVEDMPIISADEAISQYDVRTIW